ncbi:MAG: LacI family transcriptional regulator [Bifidobacterium sp.]|jgi:DNA-binding LacI/PurR family transcriptional regulator|nr:LacI family transcriptional regulator [Bifidobacterium sp.]
MVTMRDVAARAGVSQATVSYAMHNDPSISGKTRDKVLRAARELDYSANLSARSLRSGKSGAIGLVVQELSNPYSSHLADAISRYALSRGMQTITQQTLYQGENETSILEHVVSAFCDAVIFSPSELSGAQIKALLNGKPAMLLAPTDQHPGFDTIDTPCKEGFFTSTSYLLSTGCTKPVFLGTSCFHNTRDRFSNASAVQRATGFELALRRNGLPAGADRFIETKGWNMEDSRQAMLRVLDHGLEFDAVVCVNDLSALGAMRALQERGIRIPEDVSVMGFDGIEQGCYTTPSLSTISFDFDDMARQIVDTLVLRINGNKTMRPQRLVAGYSLTVRESTRARR